ncbi:hypothetical protein LRS13_01135 [Svornostia abyssi]|uniref:Uncharacterized protein n=1 Tax=Svornostia abyssi TaxID=2898438 RepID=A0ABY5PIG3_9ACTN|nr:hypothetical protein LRS13_01135 [Parviterribacteraceae bacterium J379]
MSGGGDPELGDLPGLGDDLKDLTLSLPPGQVASPQATPLCSRTKFLSNSGCPSASQVGDLSLAVDVLGAGRIDERLLQGKVFNLEPQGTEGARLGLAVDVVIGPLALSGVIHLETEARLRADDSGLDSITLDNPRDLEGIPLEVRRLNLRLWGSKADHPTMQKSFMSTPTTCNAAITRVKAVSYRGDTTNAQTSFTPTGCDQLDFKPSAIFESAREADTPGELTSGVALPDEEGPLAQSHIKKATVVLPPGFELSPTVGSNPDFTGCDDAQFNRFTEGVVSCPAGSQIGTVRFRSPLLLKQELVGKVFVANPKPGEPKVRFFVNAEAGPESDAVRVKLIAKVQIDQNTGQLTTVLDDLPATPFTEFRFSFFGGPRGPVSMPRQCGTYTGDTILEPMNGNPTKTVKASVAIDQGCTSPEPFAPTLAAGVNPLLAGADTTLVTTFTRPSGHGRLKSMELQLPTGLSGKLTVAPLCPLSVAATGSCGEESRVGRVNALAGGGSDPKALSGNVYLTEGPNGALAGLNIVVDVKVGPLDFGRVVTQATIVVRPDTGLTLVVPDIPQRQEGVEANIRQLEVVLDRAGFNLNATSCAPNQFTGTVTSDTGIVAPVTAPYQPNGCDQIPFAPKVSATIGGGAAETKEDGHPSLKVVVSQQPGEANSSKMEVVLPEGIAADSERLRSVCTLEVYAQNACPPETVKGTATAYSPLLPNPLTGPVTFVQIPGSPLPGLRIKLQGALTIELTGTVKFGDKNRLVNVIDPIPDTPLSRFELDLKTGPQAPLIATKDLCQSKTNTVDGTAWSHAGSQATIKTEADVVDCRPAGTLKLGSLRSGRPSLDLRVAGGRTRVTTAQLVVPKGLEFQRAALVKKRLRISATGLKKGSKARVTVSGQSIRVTVPSGQSATVLRVRMSSGGLRASTRLRKRGRPQLTFRLNTTTADKKSSRSNLRVRPAAR